MVSGPIIGEDNFLDENTQELTFSGEDLLPIMNLFGSASFAWIAPSIVL
jgi:hypothetical protein